MITRNSRKAAVPARTSASPSRQGGIGMIEVLVSVLILAIGLLGLAALQVTSMQSTTSAQARSQATLLAHDALERIRANSANAVDYESGLADPAPDCDLDQAPNAGASVAVNDMAQWRNQLACYLPAGNGAIEVDGDEVTVSVQWLDDRKENETLNFSFTTQL